MLILLPPSEGKTPPAEKRDARLDLNSLAMPELAPQRRQVLTALSEVSAGDEAQEVLKVGARVIPEVRRNTELDQAPAAPAWQIYTGVLFEALKPETLTAAQHRRAAESVRIFSGLFGAVGFADQIPAYRLSMGVSLPGIGRLSTWWKQSLAEPMGRQAADQLVIDCRSATYAAAYSPPAEQTLAVNSFTVRNCQRKVVTHFAKHARGELAGMLLRSRRRPTNVDEVAEIASARWEVEVRPATVRRGHQLDLISSE